MHIVKIKICGITNIEDAQAAVDMGADILGFNFYPKSPRYIEPTKAMVIIRKMPAFVDTAGIFVNANAHEIHELTNEGLLNWIQLHGDEPPEFCEQFTAWNLHTIKAIRVQSKESLARAESYRTSALLLDAFNPKLYGGTGQRFDWSLIKNFSYRVFLAGGICPDNIQEALEHQTYGIDVCSGIESQPGKKDHNKMKQLFKTVHNFTGLKVKQ
jgi:phosphoribosylanthranilate isomerase